MATVVPPTLDELRAMTLNDGKQAVKKILNSLGFTTSDSKNELIDYVDNNQPDEFIQQIIPGTPINNLTAEQLSGIHYIWDAITIVIQKQTNPGSILTTAVAAPPPGTVVTPTVAAPPPGTVVTPTVAAPPPGTVVTPTVAARTPAVTPAGGAVRTPGTVVTPTVAAPPPGTVVTPTVAARTPVVTPAGGATRTPAVTPAGGAVRTPGTVVTPTVATRTPAVTPAGGATRTPAVTPATGSGTSAAASTTPPPTVSNCVPSQAQINAVEAAKIAMDGLLQSMRAAAAGTVPKKTGMARLKFWQGGGARKSRRHSGIRNRKTQRRK